MTKVSVIIPVYNTENYYSNICSIKILIFKMKLKFILIKIKFIF